MRQPQISAVLAQLAALIARGDVDEAHDAFLALLDYPDSAVWLRALDAAGLLTQILPELEPSRGVDQPIVHFLPVLEHSLETVAAVDWLLGQLSVVRRQE